MERLKALRQTIHDEICREGWNEGLGTFTQYFGGQELDASLLLLPLVGFLPADDPRMAATIATIARDLSEGGLIRRTKAKSRRSERGRFPALLLLDGGLPEHDGPPRRSRRAIRTRLGGSQRPRTALGGIQRSGQATLPATFHRR